MDRIRKTTTKGDNKMNSILEKKYDQEISDTTKKQNYIEEIDGESMLLYSCEVDENTRLNNKLIHDLTVNTEKFK